MKARIFLFFVLCMTGFAAIGQPVPGNPGSNNYPRNYFRNPLGIPMELAANFGELRPDHWHMGLDIRTNQKENQPVYAAAEGYIAHIGVRPQSFGRFIIINHPNGLSTLYGHLNDFNAQLEQYVTEQQYQQESWAVELDFTKQKFPVSKGQFIAYSGNTGGSQGPHLHFEIFDTKTEVRFNPLLFGFPMQDQVAPNLVKLALYNRARSVFEQTPQLFLLKNTDSGYIIPKLPVIRTGLQIISFAIQAFDKMSGSSNPDGIFSARIFFDEEFRLGFELDSIDYNQTVYINAHIDYREKYNGGPFVQHLSRLAGDRSGIYMPGSGDGIIMLPDTNVHAIRIEVTDANFNTSQLNFSIQYSDSLPALPAATRDTRSLFIPNQVNTFKKPDFELYIPETGLYDTMQPVYFRSNPVTPNGVSAIHQVSDASYPLHQDITIRIKPDKPVLSEWRDKLVIQRAYRTSSQIKKAQWDGDWVTGKFGDLGLFRVFADLVPPKLNTPEGRRVGKSDTLDLSASNRIVFTPTDNFGVIRKFSAVLDSQWIRFTNDKSRNWIYIFDERCPYGEHQLTVTVEDLVGNATTQTWWFKRYPYTPPKKRAVKKRSTKKTTTRKTPKRK
jgi:hypothetical protein